MRRTRPQLVADFNTLVANLPEGMSVRETADVLTVPQLQAAIQDLRRVASNPNSEATDLLQQYGGTFGEAFFSSASQIFGHDPIYTTQSDTESLPIQERPVVEHNDLQIQNFGLQVSTTRQSASFNPDNPRTLTNLSDKQLWLQQTLATNSSSLIGLPVIIVATPAGKLIERLHEAIIVRIESNPQPALFILETTDSLAKGELYGAFIYQIEPLKNVHPRKVTAKELEKTKQQENRAIVQTLANQYKRMFNTSLNQDKEALSHKHNDYSNYIETLARLEQEIEDLHKKVASTKEIEFSPEKMLEIVSEMEKHDKVKKAFITKKGNIIVLTKMLYATNLAGDKEDTKKPVGQFVFKFSCVNGRCTMGAVNLTYAMIHDSGGSLMSRAYFHPNIRTNEICWGNNRVEMSKMLNQGDLYQAMDFSIVFFSTFPHGRNSNPYIDFDAWYQQKEPLDLNNDYIRVGLRDTLEEPLAEGKLLIGKAEATREIPQASEVEDPVYMTDVFCDNCGENGHYDYNCPEDEEDDD